MIQQFIFAGPKPGLSANAFQSYWVNFHAVEFAAKIPKIKKYLVGTQVELALPRKVPFFVGVRGGLGHSRLRKLCRRCHAELRKLSSS